MKRQRLLISIIYNAPTRGRQGNILSESSLLTVVNDVASAFSPRKYQVEILILQKSIEKLINQVLALRPDVIINLCEGFQGQSTYEAQIAGIFELMGIPYTGSPPLALLLCQDKFKTKKILQSWDLPTPVGWLAEKGTALPDTVKFPVIVKPNTEDASIGINDHSVVHDQRSLKKRIRYIHKTHAQPALVEEYIAGREFHTTIIDDPQPRLLPISEIPFVDYPSDSPHILSYAGKWLKSHVQFKRTMPICPVTLPAPLYHHLQNVALLAYQAMQLRGYARLDFRCDKRERLYIIDINPNPDICRNDEVADALEAAGIRYEDFWERQIKLTLKLKHNAAAPQSCGPRPADYFLTGAARKAAEKFALTNPKT